MIDVNLRLVQGRDEGWRACRGELTLVIVHDVAQMVAAAVVGPPHAHGIVREVDIAIVA